LYFNCETEVNDLDRLKVLNVINDYIAWLQVSVNKVLAVNVLYPEQNTFNDLSAFLICELLALGGVSRKERLSRRSRVVIIVVIVRYLIIA
jgi:hypothetical protein